MKIKDLIPGTLLQPKEGFVWVVTPWRGTGGVLIGSYLKVTSLRYAPAADEAVKGDKVLYIGDTTTTHAAPTPGKQIVLAWGEKMTVDPTAWRNIKPIS